MGAIDAGGATGRDDCCVMPGFVQRVNDAMHDGADPVYLGRVGVCHKPNPHAPTIAEHRQGAATAA